MAADDPITVDNKGRLLYAGGGGLVPDTEARAYLGTRFPGLFVPHKTPGSRHWRLALEQHFAEVFAQRQARQQRREALWKQIDQLEGQGREELIILESRVLVEVQAINSQMQRRRGDQQAEIEAAWQTRAIAALHAYQLALRQIRARLRQLDGALAEAFMDAARRLLPAAQFHALQQAAQAAVCNNER